MGKKDDNKAEKVVNNKKVQFYNKWWFWVIVAVTAFFLIAGLAPQPQTDTTPSAGSTADGSASSSIKTIKGEKLTDYWNSAYLSETFTMGVSSEFIRPVEYKYSFEAPESGKEYVAVNVIFRNAEGGNQEEDYNTLKLYLEDEKGNKYYTQSLSGDEYLDYSGLVQSGETANGYVVFEIGKTQKMSDMTLHYTDIDRGLDAVFTF